MAILRKTLKTLAAGTVITSVFIYQRTKNSEFIPLSADDAIFQLADYKRNNPHRNPAMQDLCVKRIPVGKVRFELVDGLARWQEKQEKDKLGKGDIVGEKAVEEGKGNGKGNTGWSFTGMFGGAKEKVEEVVKQVEVVKKEEETTGEEYALIEQFCAGVWSGLGYQPQRTILSRKYQHLPSRTTSPSQLWTRSSLKSSTYPVGTHITDHFEVVSKTPTSIIVRCGDSPLTNDGGLRDSDGLFEIGVKVVPAEGLGGIWGAGKGAEVEFSLKSVFFKGASKVQVGEGMPQWMVYMHRLYTKVLMETAVFNVMV